jgi:hypothetical protein
LWGIDYYLLLAIELKLSFCSSSNSEKKYPTAKYKASKTNNAKERSSSSFGNGQEANMM